MPALPRLHAAGAADGATPLDDPLVASALRKLTALSIEQQDAVRCALGWTKAGRTPQSSWEASTNARRLAMQEENGMTIAAIARKENATRGAVKQSLRRARRARERANGYA
jgi:hypothetical protein